ncbi:MAG: F0F1 ATP synthase subunit delta [Pseudomonadales bacterium]|nr:F0F1 ATP synthase subunit delta [Pseudomonadales bacterium]
MAELITVARPYAKAAFQFADENGALAEWSDMLAFAAAVSTDEAVSSFLNNPKITSAQKAEAFGDLCKDKLNAQGKNFVAMLAQNKRLAALPEIATLFEALKSQKEQSVDVEITSAFALSDEQGNKLAAALKQKLGREVNVTTAEDKALLGGVIIRAGDMVIDGSVRGKLAKLAEKLNS